MRRKSRLRTNRFSDEDVNPMDGVGNMSDVMLCLAVGIMLALITNWNVDISTGVSQFDINNAQEVNQEKVTEVDQGDTQESPDSSGYEKYGQVYKDPKTGKIYIITDE